MTYFELYCKIYFVNNLYNNKVNSKIAAKINCDNIGVNMEREYIRYFFSKSDWVEVVYSKNVKLSFAEHNHTSSYIIGIIIDGIVLLNRNNEVKPYKKDNYYIIAPYEPHSVSSDGQLQHKCIV